MHRNNTSPRGIQTHVAKLSYSNAENIRPKQRPPNSVTMIEKIPTSSPQTSPEFKTTTTQEVFNKKRTERDKEIKEIQSMLDEIKKSPKKYTQPEKVQSVNIPELDIQNTPSTDTYIFSKSKTEYQLKRTNIARRAQTYIGTSRVSAGSSQPSPPKTKESLPDSDNRKRKSYNPEEARRFMEEQKKKRRSKPAGVLTQQTGRDKAAFDKEQIKKRLEELKKNSRKIVKKNLEKKRFEHTQKTGTNRDRPSEMPPKESPAEKPEIKILYQNPKVSPEKTEKAQNEHRHIASDESRKPDLNLYERGQGDSKRPSTGKSDTTKASHNSNPLVENQKRIGLLRKPEIKDHSFSAIKDFSFDKENVALEMMTPKFTLPAESRAKEKFPSQERDKISVEESLDKVSPVYMPTGTFSSVPPSECVQSCHAVSEKSTQVHDTSMFFDTVNENKTSAYKNDSDERANLHYWLKPSAVQIYPYNFIMAVRRKLEAIANPVPPQLAVATSTTNNQTTSTSDLVINKRTEICLNTREYSNRLVQPQQNAKRRLLKDCVDKKESARAPIAGHTTEAKKSIEMVKKLVPLSEIQEDGDDHVPKSQSQALSDVNSNLSSISIQLPASNTASEMSSIHTESQHYAPIKTKSETASQSSHHPSQEDDDTTVSSSIYNSPEKKINRKITSSDDFHFIEPRPVSPLSLEGIENLKITSKSKFTERTLTHMKETVEHPSDEEKDVDFNQLLDDFNRSLSQVIQVNAQLKSTLDKSQQMFVSDRSSGSIRQKDARTSGKDEKEVDVYTTDFEASSLETSHKTNEENERQTEERQTHSNQRITSKKTLFEIVNTETPLLTSPPKSDSNAEDVQEMVPSLGLGSHSLTNSSAFSTASKNNLACDDSESQRENANTTPDEMETSFPKEHEKRIRVIEQLKKDLQQSILNSRANRKNEGIETATASEGGSEEKQSFSHRSEEQENSAEKSIDENDDIQTRTKKPGNEHNLENNTLESPAPADTKDSASAQSVKHSSASSSTQSRQIDTVASNHTRKSEASLAPTSPSVEALISPALSNKTSTRSPRKSSRSRSSESNSPQLNSANSHTENTDSNSPLSSTDFNSKSISEELQNEGESSSKDNEQINHKVTKRSLRSATPHSEQISNRAHETFIKSHVNNLRGDFIPDVERNSISNETDFHVAVAQTSQNIEADDSCSSAEPPPSYNAVAVIKSHKQIVTNKSAGKSSSKSSNPSQPIGSEIVAFFNQSDVELSILSSNNCSLSESSLNYSNVGLYEKLIQNETTKSEHLTALLKMREKALLHRTKGQIAWLEVQKERYKAKGLMIQIAAIKKKQRGILLKMEKEREEIKRLLQSTSTSGGSTQTTAHPQNSNSASSHTPSQRKRNHASPQSAPVPLPSTTVPPTLLPLVAVPHPKTPRSTVATATRSAPIVRANYELESSRSLVELLQKREADLHKRRQHVERLMQWHQRLDQEEAEVLQLERMLLNYNNAHVPQGNATEQGQNSVHEPKHTPPSGAAPKSPQLQPSNAKMERRLKEIDKSLRELSSISNAASNDESGGNVENVVDFVRTTGSKLNKLWRRLTSQQIEKFEPNRRYKLCKSDLESLYEEAKIAVLRDFAQDEERVAAELLERSASNLTITSSSNSQLCVISAGPGNVVHVPPLNLSRSSEQSEAEEEGSVAEVSSRSLPQGNYSPSAAEEDFNMMRPDSKSNSSASESGSNMMLNSIDRKMIIEKNIHKFLAFTQHSVARNLKLQRSLSDTQIAEQPPSSSSSRTAGSQCNLALARNQTRSPTKSNASSVLTRSSIESYSPPAAVSATDTTLQSVQSIRTLPPSHETSLSNILPTTPRSDNETEHSPHQVHESSSQGKVVSAEQNTLTERAATKTSEEHDVISVEEAVETADSIPTPTRELSVICSVGQANSLYSATRTDPTINDHSNRTDTVSPAVDTAHTLSPPKMQTITTDSSAETTTEAQEFSADSTNTAETSAAAHSNTFSVQASTEFDSKVAEISEKLEQISAKVSELTQTQPLPPTYQSTKIPEITSIDSNDVSASIITPSNDGDTPNVSADASYTCHFENISSDVYSPSGCTLKSTSAHSSAPPSARSQAQSTSCSIELANDETSHISSTTFTKSPPAPLSSQTFVSDPYPLRQSEIENRILDTYRADFESDSDETRIEDITLPQFETTADTTQEEDEDEGVEGNSEKNSTVSEPQANTSKSASKETFEVLPTSPPPLPPPPAQQGPPTAPTLPASTTNTNSSGGSPLMPDIINELEIRRCQQILFESEHLKQYEHVTAVPYMYVREIPNKPPPPYVPPAHGSPMTTIFPSEERIKDITYRRTHELYCEILKTDYINEKGEKLPSVMEEKITNIYERIILDICREFLTDNSEVLKTQVDPTNFHSQLAFFNPPNRMRCLQESVYKEVRRCLAMDKTPPKRTQVYSVYGQRAKSDHIGKIIIQEMYDEDDRWCNFHREESEVLALIVEEMITNNVRQLAKDVLLEEGGVIEEEEVEVEDIEAASSDELEEEASSAATTASLEEQTAESAAETSGDAFITAEPGSSTSANDAPSN